MFLRFILLNRFFILFLFFWEKIYRKAALKLVQDLGEEAFPEPKQSVSVDEGSSQTADLAAESVVSASNPVESSTQESTSTSANTPLEPPPPPPPSETDGKKSVTTNERKPMKIPSSVHVRITPDNLKDYVGPPVYQKDRMYTHAPPPGVSTGLGYSGNGSGAVMPVEAMVSSFYKYPVCFRFSLIYSEHARKRRTPIDW